MSDEIRLLSGSCYVLNVKRALARTIMVSSIAKWLSRNRHVSCLVCGFIVGCTFTKVLALFPSETKIMSPSLVFLSHVEKDFNSIGCDVIKATERLYDEVKIICWISTIPKNVAKQQAIMDTWGKRCHQLFFMVGRVEGSEPSEKANFSANAQMVQLDMNDTYMKLWQKTKLAFKYIYQHHIADADWILKGDDDTYVEMTNLRLFLKDQKANESDKHWFGGRFRHDGGYNSGGSAYILSRSVLEQLVQVGLSKNICNSDVEGYEDQQMGICLNKLNITTGHTADEYGRLKFLPFKLETLLNPESDKQKYGWFKAFSLYPLKEGLECCSDAVIGFHYVSPSQMWILEYLINQVPPVYSRNSSDFHC